MSIVSKDFEDINAYLERNQRKELLRFLTCGSVDDGKSTLIGRLLHDTKGIYEDQLAAVKRDSAKHGTTGAGEVDLALLTDGLKAEREQGITIDVAYRYFSTDKRKFIIADTPGHEQYTRNMATGASTCQLAIILIDARHGVMVQTKRHSFIVSLLGIQHIVVAVNKMDLAGYSQATFEKIKSDYTAFAQKLGIQNPLFIPMSALKGQNVVDKDASMPWYTGPALLEHLETVPLETDQKPADLRFPVQYVLRPNLNFRGFAGTIASGLIRAGDAVTVLPSGKKSRVKSIVTYEGDLPEAFAPMSVTLTLTDEIDTSRGDMLVHTPLPNEPSQLPQQSAQVEAMVVWMHEKPMLVGSNYLIKHTTRLLTAQIRDILYATDVNTLQEHAATKLGLNEVGRCVLRAAQPLIFDPYQQNHATGAFIIIDRITNNTVGAGMILQAHQPAAHHGGPVSQMEKETRLGQQGLVLWIAGTDSATPAATLERHLFEEGRTVVQLDADHLGLSEPDAAKLAQALSAQGFVCIVAAQMEPSPATRDQLGDRLLMAVPELPAILSELRQRGLLAPEIPLGDGI